MALFKIDVNGGDGKMISSTVIADGSGEPDPDRVITENEKFYDAEIAPALAKIAEKCKEKGMAFGAIVEYNKGEDGTTILASEDMGLPMQMSLMAMRSTGNIDKLIMGYIKTVKAAGRDLEEESIFLRLAKSRSL